MFKPIVYTVVLLADLIRLDIQLNEPICSCNHRFYIITEVKKIPKFGGEKTHKKLSRKGNYDS